MSRYFFQKPKIFFRLQFYTICHIIILSKEKGIKIMGNYIKKSVNQNQKENVMLETGAHWVSLIAPGAVAAFFVLLAFDVGRSDISGALILLFLAFLVICRPLINVLTTELGFSNKRIIGKRGLIKTKSMDSPLSKINNVAVNNGLLGKILGYGNIVITTSSGIYPYRSIAKPEQFKTALMNQIDQYDEDRIKKQATEMANAINTAQ